jgi:hypothetical protein
MSHTPKPRTSPYLSGFLAIWILLLSFASVCLALHDRLHGHVDSATQTHSHCSDKGHESQPHSDSKSPDSGTNGGTHFCGITALQVGALLTLALSVSQARPFARVTCEFFEETVERASSPFCYQARAPPIESIV